MAGDLFDIASLARGFATNARQVETDVEKIIEKYDREFPDDDIVELQSLCIIKDRGKLRHLKPRRVGCTKSSKSRHRQDYTSSESSLAESIQDVEIKTEPKDLVDISVISESCIRWAEMSDEPSDAETISSDSGSEDWEIDECSSSSSSEKSSLEVTSIKSDEEDAEDNTIKWLTLEPRKTRMKAAESKNQPNRNIPHCVSSHCVPQIQKFPSRSDSFVQHSSPQTREACSTYPGLLSFSASDLEVRDTRRLSARQEEGRGNASLKRIVPIQLYPEKIQQKSERKEKEEETDLSSMRESSLLQFAKCVQVSNPGSGCRKPGEMTLKHQHPFPSLSKRSGSGQLLPGRDQPEKSSKEKEKCLKQQYPCHSPTKRSGSVHLLLEKDNLDIASKEIEECLKQQYPCPPAKRSGCVQLLPGKDQLEKASKGIEECLKQQYPCPSPSERTGSVQLPLGEVELKKPSKEKQEWVASSWCQGEKGESMGTKSRDMPTRNTTRKCPQLMGNVSRPSVIKSTPMKSERYAQLVNTSASSHPCYVGQVLFANRAFAAHPESERELSQDIIEEKLNRLYISECGKCTLTEMSARDLSLHGSGLWRKTKFEDIKAGSRTPPSLLLTPDSSVKSEWSANGTPKKSLPVTKTESPSCLAQARQRFIPAPFPPLTTEQVHQLFSISDMDAFVELCIDSSCKKAEKMSHSPRPVNLWYTPEKKSDHSKAQPCPPTEAFLHSEVHEKLLNCYRFVDDKHSALIRTPSRDAPSVDSGFYSPVSFSKRSQQDQSRLTNLPKQTALERSPEKEMVCAKSELCTEKKSRVCQENLTIPTNSCKQVEENFPAQLKWPSRDETYVCLEGDRSLSFSEKWKHYQSLEKKETLWRTPRSAPCHSSLQIDPSCPCLPVVYGMNSQVNNKARELDLLNLNTSQDLTTYCTKVLDRMTLSNPSSPRRDCTAASRLPLSISPSPNVTFSVSPFSRHSKLSSKDIHQAFMNLKLSSMERQQNKEGAVSKEVKLCSKHFEQKSENRQCFVQRNHKSVTDDSESVKHRIIKSLVTDVALYNRKSFTDSVKHGSDSVAQTDSSHVSKATASTKSCKEIFHLSTDTIKVLNGPANTLSRPRVLHKWKNISSCNLNDTVVVANAHDTRHLTSGAPGHHRNKMVYISSPCKPCHQPGHFLSSETFCVSPSSRKRRLDGAASQPDFSSSVCREGRKPELAPCKRQRTSGTFLTSTPTKSVSREAGKGFYMDDTLSTISGEGSDIHITVTSGDCSGSNSSEEDTVILVT